MTHREKEIFEIIQQMPMIEQSEIAAKLNITRSSVAVHIANLQKKGYVLGRGYLLREQEYVVGIGAANVDIHGRSKAEIVLRDSNPGHMNCSAGGVTRNVCDNLARMGAPVKLIAALGDDIYADQIRNECSAAGIDYSHSVVIKNHPSSTYISILDEIGDMFVAMSDMSVLQKMDMEFLKTKNAIINGASIVTCDGGLPIHIIEGILDLYAGNVPVYVDPVSGAYAKKIQPYIGGFHTAKPNRMELSILSGKAVETEEDLKRAGDVLLEKGLERLFVSVGKDGCFYMDRSGNIQKRRLQPLEKMVNATGGGDAFMAAVIYASLHKYEVEETLDLALAAGVAAVSSERTINPHISMSLLKKILEERRI